MEDRAWADYSASFRTEVLPNLMNSACFLSIGAETGEFDVKQATELGVALLLDKPFLLLIPKGRTVGERLRRAADVVVDDWDPRETSSQERLVAAIRQLGLEDSGVH